MRQYIKPFKGVNIKYYFWYLL